MWASVPAWFLLSGVAPLLLPEVGVGGGVERLSVTSFDGGRSFAAVGSAWHVGLTLTWRRPAESAAETDVVGSGSEQTAVDAAARRLWVDRAKLMARPPAAGSLRDRVFAALLLAEIDAQLLATL